MARPAADYSAACSDPLAAGDDPARREMVKTTSVRGAANVQNFAAIDAAASADRPEDHPPAVPAALAAQVAVPAAAKCTRHSAPHASRWIFPPSRDAI